MTITLNVCLDVVNLKDAHIFYNAMTSVLKIAIVLKQQDVVLKVIVLMKLVVKVIKTLEIIVMSMKNVIAIIVLIIYVQQPLVSFSNNYLSTLY